MNNNNNNKVELETREILSTKKELAFLKKGYKTLGPALNNYSTHIGAQEVAKGELVADALLGFADSQNGALGNILKAAGIAQRKLNQEQLQLANFLKDNVAVTILDTYKNDVKRVSELRKLQSMARVQHDAALNDLIALQKKNDTEKIPIAQSQCVNTKEKYPSYYFTF